MGGGSNKSYVREYVYLDGIYYVLYSNVHPMSFSFLRRHPICLSVSQISSVNALNNMLVRHLQTLGFCAKFWQQFRLGLSSLLCKFMAQYTK